MGRKKVNTKKVNTKRPADNVPRELPIGDVLGKYMDPTDGLSVAVQGNKVIVNLTQIGKVAVDGLATDLENSGYDLILVDCDPRTVTFEGQNQSSKV